MAEISSTSSSITRDDYPFNLGPVNLEQLQARINSDSSASSQTSEHSESESTLNFTDDSGNSIDDAVID